MILRKKRRKMRTGKKGKGKRIRRYGKYTWITEHRKQDYWHIKYLSAGEQWAAIENFRAIVAEKWR